LCVCDEKKRLGNHSPNMMQNRPAHQKVLSFFKTHVVMEQFNHARTHRRGWQNMAMQVAHISIMKFVYEWKLAQRRSLHQLADKR
jgi:hypothetical protein